MGIVIALRARAAIALGDGDAGLSYAQQAYAMQPSSPLTANMLLLALNSTGQQTPATQYLAAKARVLSAN